MFAINVGDLLLAISKIYLFDWLKIGYCQYGSGHEGVPVLLPAFAIIW